MPPETGEETPPDPQARTTDTAHRGSARERLRTLFPRSNPQPRQRGLCAALSCGALAPSLRCPLVHPGPSWLADSLGVNLQAVFSQLDKGWLLVQRQRLYRVIHLPLAPSLQTGVEPKSVQDRLGHADISVTLNTYTHVLPDARAEVARKIEEVII